MSGRVDDQWFKVGDKVARVEGNAKGEVTIKSPLGVPQYGQVYCVSAFYEGPRFNAIMLVGFGAFLVHANGTFIGFRASAFRKVEEIALCVKAARRLESPQEVETAHESAGRG